MDDEVTVIQHVLHEQVLPQLRLELALSDPDSAWLSEWLSDGASVFRLLRRHKSFTLQEIRAIAKWRIRVLRPILLLTVPTTLFHCLPPPITDLFGHPIVFLRLTSIQSLTGSVQNIFLQEVERLRLHLRYIRDHCTHTGPFPLQYLLLIDLDGLSIQNYNLDLCSWVLSDVIPRYPGMIAAVFLLNHSWLYSGAWSVLKRVLPSSIIARVFFPSTAQLVNYCSAANLPAEYGGSLPILDRIDDALRSPYQLQYLPPPPPPPYLSDVSPPPPFPSSSSNATLPPDSTLQRSPTITLPPLSSRNPFFGYITIVSASNPHTIRQVQRGPRELLRTLAILWWRRWRRWVWTWMWSSTCAAALIFVLRLRRSRARTRPVLVR